MIVLQPRIIELAEYLSKINVSQMVKIRFIEAIKKNLILISKINSELAIHLIGSNSYSPQG